MLVIESSTSISRPPDKVFEFVSDVRNEPQWHTDVIEAQVDGGEPIRKGTVFTLTMKPFMGITGGTETIAEWTPPRRVVMEGRMGNLAPTIIFTVEPDGGGSRLTRRVEMNTPGMLRIMGPLMKGMARRKAQSFVDNLKKVLETR